MGQHGQQLVLDVSVELGVSVPEVLEAYKLIVQQATCKKGKNRDKVKAIIFNRKRLMRKTFRSFIYYCYGLVSTKDMNPAEEADFGANEAPCNIELQRENMHPNEIQDIIPVKQSKWYFEAPLLRIYLTSAVLFEIHDKLLYFRRKEEK